MSIFGTNMVVSGGITPMIGFITRIGTTIRTIGQTLNGMEFL